MSMLQIGVLINDSIVNDWENEIIVSLIKEKKINITIIKNHEFRKESRNIKSIFKNKFVAYLFKIQFKIEKRISENISEVKDYIKNVNIQENDSNDVFFDLIINLSYDRSNVLQKSKYGVLELFYNNAQINYGNKIGLKEIVHRLPSIELELLHYSKSNLKGKLVDKAFYTYHWSAQRNNTNVFKILAPFIIKNINAIKEYKIKSVIINKDNYLQIGFLCLLKYIVFFYSKIISNLYKKICFRFLDLKIEYWTLSFGQKINFKAELKNITTIDLPKNEFWADPFLYKKDDELYVFFEKYVNKIGRGIISCGKYKEGKVVDVLDILNLGYHLSYPNVFEEDGVTYMIPEISEKKCLEIYKCTSFPDKWELFSSSFNGEFVVDTVYFKDENGIKWLFLSKSKEVINDNCSELYIYQIDSLEMINIIPHKQNPVLVNSEFARNGGGIFMFDKKIVRPSQDNTFGVYGRKINFNEIIKLDIESYEEKNIKEYSKPFENMKRIHHFHKLGEDFVFDSYY